MMLLNSNSKAGQKHVTGKQGINLWCNLFFKRDFKQWLIWLHWEKERHMNLGPRNKPNQQRMTHCSANVMKTKC